MVMELIDRYINEVGRRLPQGKRDDICREIRSALDDALEARSFGEPSESDVVAVLDEFGSPQSVAASYSGDKYLVGPELYPHFITTLKIVTAVLAGLVVLGSAAPLVTGIPGLRALVTALSGTVNGMLEAVVSAVGIVVIIFALLERLDLRLEIAREKKAWNPLELPAVTDLDIVGRFESIAAIVFPAIVLGLMNSFKDRIGLHVSQQDHGFSVGIVGDPQGELLLNDVFLDNLPWINVSMLLPMALSVWLFWSGRWRLPTRLLKIAFDAFGAFVFYRICQGLIAAQGQILEAGLPEKPIGMIVRGLEVVPYFIFLAVLIGAGSHLYKAFKSTA
jgi:hypothetical protein